MKQAFSSIVVCSSLLFSLASGEAATNKLPTLNIDIHDTSVSGISSGGYFATQMQVAYSSIIRGAAIIAAGPYNCGAEHLMTYCMQFSWPYNNGIDMAKKWSGDKIDKVENMKKQKVYMVSGSKDDTVIRQVTNYLYDFYAAFIPKENIDYNQKLNITHTFPTDFPAEGNSGCELSTSPYISNCGFDFVGAAFKQIYGDMGTRTDKPTGDWITFDQSDFISNNDKPHSVGLGNDGYLYVPKACQGKTANKCRLHVAFHGCGQNDGAVGTKFLHSTGYDRWADLNKVIVMFPQTVMDLTLKFSGMNGWVNNYGGCWDWAGWYDDQFQTKNGRQMASIKNMIDRVAGIKKNSTLTL